MDRTAVLEALRPMVGLRARDADSPVVTLDQGRAYIRPRPRARTVEVTPLGFETLLARAHIPDLLARKLTPITLARTATEALVGQHSLLEREGLVVDIAPAGRYRLVETERVLDAIEAAVPQADFTRALTLPGQVVQLESVGVEEKPVRRGDLVRAGALVRYSPVGTLAPTVQSYVQRLACTNGAMTMDVLRRFEFGGGDGNGGMWQWLRRSVRDAYHALEVITARWAQLTEERVAEGDRAFILEGLLRQAGIRKEMAQAVRAEALRQPPETAYDMLNLLTWASTHVLGEPRAVVRAQQAAAAFGSEEHHALVCPVCHRNR